MLVPICSVREQKATFLGWVPYVGAGCVMKPRIFELIWTIVSLLAGPLNVVLTRRLVASHVPTTVGAYTSTIRGLGVLGLITLLVDLLGSRIGLRTLCAQPGAKTLLVWTAATLGMGLAISGSLLLVRKLLRQPLSPLLALLLPKTTTEHMVFLGVALMAGLVEEYVFRGFCMGVLISATKSKFLSFLPVTLAFGIGHGYQDVLGVVRATLLGAILALPVLATGALLPSVVTHAAVDAIAGLPAYSSLLRHWGLIA